MLANTIVGDDGWWLLVEIDPETGEVVSEHVIATDSFEYGWNAFDAPEITTVGDRMFMRDHRRRIVEVESRRWGGGPRPPGSIRTWAGHRSSTTRSK